MKGVIGPIRVGEERTPHPSFFPKKTRGQSSINSDLKHPSGSLLKESATYYSLSLWERVGVRAMAQSDARA